MFPTKYEVYLDDDTTLIAKFEMFDEESFEVEIKTILGSDDLRDVADLLDEALIINKLSIKSSKND